jgi:hypothetical protein
MVLTAHSGPRPLIQFRNHFYTDGMTPWTSDQPVARRLHKHRTTQTQNKHIHQTSMPWVIPASERAKTVHNLDRAAAVTGHPILLGWSNQRWGKKRLGRHWLRWEDDIKLDRRHVMRLWTILCGLRIRSSGKRCGHLNELSSSIKGGEFLDRLSDCYRLHTGFCSVE